MKRNGLIGTAAAVSGTFGISWLGAIVYWRTGLHTPGPLEVASLLLGMPTAMLAGMAWWRRRGTRGADGVATVDPDPHDACPKAPSAQRGMVAALPAVALNLPCGDEPETIVDCRGSLEPIALHPTLRDPDGIPVFAAAIDRVDPLGHALHVESAHRAGTPRPEWLRALAAAQPVLEALLAGVDTPPAGALLLVPGDWSDAERKGAGSHLERQLHAALAEGAAWVRVEQVEAGTEALARAAAAAPADAAGAPVLCVAMASHIGEQTVRRWATGQRLLGSGTPQGRAPGEGAAGVVLAHPGAGCAAPEWRVLREQDREDPRDRGAALAALIESTLATGGVEAVSISLVATDADHRADVLVETGSALSTALPDLDAGEDCLHLGQSCGDSGGVLAIASLALAASACAQRPGNTLALSFDRRARSAALVVPASPAHPVST